MKARFHMGMRIEVVLVAATALLVWGCVSQSRVYDIDPAHRPALHAVHEKRLASAMKRINKNYLHAQRLPVRVQRERDFRLLSQCADEIAAYATELPESATLGGLSAEDKAVFERLLGQLKVNAEALKVAADNRDGTDARTAFARLSSTCNSCHAAFRQTMDHDGHGGPEE